MASSRSTLSAFTDAAADAVARVIAEVRRDAAREREAFAAEMRAARAEWEARLASVAEVERRLADRLALLKDGAPGRDGVDGRDGEPGSDGRDGADGRDGVDGAAGKDGRDGIDGKDGADAPAPTIEQVTEAVRAVLPETVGDAVASYFAANPVPAGQDGRDGQDGKDADPVSHDAIVAAVLAAPEALASAVTNYLDQNPPAAGRDGVDGKNGQDGADADPVVIRQMVEEAVSTIPVPKDGRDGVDGKDGRDGEPGPKGEPGDKGEPGERGADGRDGIDGAPGERGPEGPAGKLPTVTEWEDRVHYEGEVVTRDGRLFQALRDTGKAPGHEDWRCIVERGQDGTDGRSFTIRGTYVADGDYQMLDVVALNGASFAAKRDKPGTCPGEGWQLIASQGKQGKPGLPGERGDRGLAVTASVKAARISDDGMLTLVNADGSEVECDLYPVLSKIG